MGLVERGDGFESFYWTDDKKNMKVFWKNENANSRGRLIHSDGDVYEGEWKEIPV